MKFESIYILYLAFFGFALAEWLQLIPIVMSVLVGISIIAVNYVKIKAIKKKDKDD